jgi:hypothetical protein
MGHNATGRRAEKSSGILLIALLLKARAAGMNE